MTLPTRRTLEYLADNVLAVVFVTPTSGDVITTEPYNFTWAISAGLQEQYRLVIFEQDGETVVFDSGWTVTSGQAHALATDTLLSGADYIAQVFVANDQGESGETDPTAFSTAYPTSVDISNVSARTVGGCDDDQSTLPGIIVSWSEVTPGGGETFVDYEVRRRLDGGEWVVKARITDSGVTRYVDYEVPPGSFAEYAVVWRAQTATELLTSTVPSNPSFAVLLFDFSFLHSPDDPIGSFIRFDHWAGDVSVSRDRNIEPTWGRSAPTQFIGEQFYHVLTIPGLGRQRGARGEQYWKRLEALIESGEALCFRIGIDRERYFVSAAGPSKRLEHGTFGPSLELTEVFYDEER